MDPNWNEELESMAANGVIPYPEWRKKQLKQPGLIHMLSNPKMAMEAVKGVASDPMGTVVKPMIDMAMYPGQVAMGKKSPTDASGRFTDEAIQMGMDIPGLITGQNVVRNGFKPGNPNVARIFAGENADGAPLNELKIAKEMEKGNADPREIWSKTGWFKNADGKWRWEIDDSGIQYNVKPFNKAKRNRPKIKKEYQRINAEMDAEDAKLPDPSMPPTDRWFDLSAERMKLDEAEYIPINEGLLGFDAVSKAYPDLNELTMQRWKLPNGYWGEFVPDEGRISFNERIPEDQVMDTIIHEIQHAVQEQSGHAPGIPPSIIPTKHPAAEHLHGLWQDIVNYKIDDYRMENGRMPTKGEIDIMERRAAHEMYMADLGEAEARAATARRKMTPEERRATFPMDSYDEQFPIAPKRLRPPLKGKPREYTYDLMPSVKMNLKKRKKP